jgi:hypothetical protein
MSAIMPTSQGSQPRIRMSKASPARAGNTSFPQESGRLAPLPLHLNERLVTTIAAGTVLTPGEWLLERRMLAAERLLKGTELTMADIASRSRMSGAGQLFRARRGTTLNRCEQRLGERTVGDAVSSASDLAAGNWNNDGPLVWPGLEPSARLPRQTRIRRVAPRDQWQIDSKTCEHF